MRKLFPKVSMDFSVAPTHHQQGLIEDESTVCSLCFQYPYLVTSVAFKFSFQSLTTKPVFLPFLCRASRRLFEAVALFLVYHFMPIASSPSASTHYHHLKPTHKT